MPYPFLGVCGALHLEDVWPLYAAADPLGLCDEDACVSRPVMKRAREIEAANDRLGNAAGSNRLESLSVDRFYRVYQAHAHEHRDDLIFSYHLGYPFVNYTFALDYENEAKQLFVRHFDHHATLQEENYLVQHEASKRQATCSLELVPGVPQDEVPGVPQDEVAGGEVGLCRAEWRG
jgi:hypothetical protein